MKNLLALLMIVSSFSAFAVDEDDMTVDFEVVERDCRVEVLEDIMIYSSTEAVLVGSVVLTPGSVNRRVHRRLAAGRVLKVRRADEQKIYFADSAIRSLYINTQQNIPLWTYNWSKSLVETYSDGTLRMICEEKRTVDI